MSRLEYCILERLSAVFRLRPPASSMAQGLIPGPDWDGTTASGFSSAPTDPTRTTAKPGLHLITPDRQHFSDTLDVCALAMANDEGTLFSTFGIARVEFIFEGRTLSVTEPSWHTIMTERGPKIYFGWWARLQKPDETEGYAHLYIRAVPRNTTMQNRVIGPFTFGLRDNPYDGTLSVQPSEDEVAGERYQSIPAAMAYAKGEDWQNYRVRIDEAGKYDLADEAPSATDQKGWCEITAGVAGVSIGKSSYTTDAAATVHPNKSPIRFRGSNLTFDLRHVQYMRGAENNLWLDGITITTTDPAGRNERIRGLLPGAIVGRRFDPGAYFTECHIEKTANVCAFADLVRGCTLDEITFDIFYECECAVFNSITDHSGDVWTQDNPGITITYTGSEANASVSKESGTGGGEFDHNIAVFTFTYGANSTTFTCGRGEDYFDGTEGDGYSVQDLVDWINDTLAGLDEGWSATIEDADFGDVVATELGLAGDEGRSFDEDAKDVDLELKWTINAHSDFFQRAGGIHENIILAFNIGGPMEVQVFFCSPTLLDDEAGFSDLFIVGNAIYVSEETKTYYDPSTAFSQFGRSSGGTLSHVVFAHNSMNQGIFIRNDNDNNTADAYCLFTNSVIRNWQWAGANVLENIEIKNLHLFAGALAPTGSTNVTVGGDATSLFADMAALDFEPKSALLDDGFTPTIPTDLTRNSFYAASERGDSAGALSVTNFGLNLGLGLYTPPPPSENPETDLLAQFDGVTDGESSFHDFTEATDTGTLTAPDQSAAGNDFTQATNQYKPSIVAGGLSYDGTDDYVTRTISGGTWSVYVRMTKDEADDIGSILTPAGGTHFARYASGASTALTESVQVDGEAVTTQGALHDALDDGAEHTVAILGLDLTGETEINVGRSFGSMQGTVRRVAMVLESEFPSTLAEVRALAVQAVEAS